MKLTPWFDRQFNPARKGVYQRRMRRGGEVSYSYFDGTFWHRGSIFAASAIESQKSHYQRTTGLPFQWRGIIKE